MPSQVVQRVATSAELAFLEKTLRDATTNVRRWKQGGENALVLWAVSLLGLVVIWLAFAWVVRKLFFFDVGLHSAAAVWVLGIGTPICAVYAGISSTRWVRSWKDYRPLLQADIAAGQVTEEHYGFTSAKRFQEPEHGGLIYFLRTTEDKVLTLFDHESQDLGAQGGDPLKSSFVPRSELVMVRAPKTGLVIDKTFAGALLEAGEPVELSVGPKHWPESESCVNIAWSELESRLGSGPSKALA
jgi:hypothetical protein